MGYYLEDGWHYWEGDPRPEAKNVIEVPQRPSPDHIWDGKEWIITEEKQAELDKMAEDKEIIDNTADLIRDLQARVAELEAKISAG